MTLDATVAGASANSYLTVAAADALAESDMGPEAVKWLDANTTVVERERALKRATREIDGYVRTGWLPYAGTQALRFPREIDAASGVAYIPSDITMATYHQAAYVLKNANIIDGANARHARALTQFSEPNISGSVDDGVNIISPRAMHYLTGFEKASASKGGSGVRSVRLSGGFPA